MTPPVYLTPKSSSPISPDAMASCPSPPHRADATISCEAIIGLMAVPELKLGDDAKLGYYLVAPNNRGGDVSDVAPSFVPFDRVVHRFGSVVVPIITLRPRPTRSTTKNVAQMNDLGITAPSFDDNEEEGGTPPSSTSVVTRAKTTTTAAVTPTTMKTSSIKAIRDKKRQKIGSPLTVNASAVIARAAAARRPSFTSRAA